MHPKEMCISSVRSPFPLCMASITAADGAISRRDFARFDLASRLYQKVYRSDLRLAARDSKRIRTLEHMCGKVKLTLQASDLPSFDREQRERARREF